MDGEMTEQPGLAAWLARQTAVGGACGLLGLAGVLYLPFGQTTIRAALAMAMAVGAVWAVEALIRRAAPRLDARTRTTAEMLQRPARMAVWGALVWGVPMALVMGGVLAMEAGRTVAGQIFGAPSLIWLAGGAVFGLIMCGFMKGVGLAADRMAGGRAGS